jgi:hypothetical protein
VLHGQVDCDNAGFPRLAEKLDVRTLQKHFQSPSGFAEDSFLAENKDMVGFL